MAFGDVELQDMVAVGLTTARSARVWARSVHAGRHRLVLRPADAEAAVIDVEVALDPSVDDGTGAWTLPGSFAHAGDLEPDCAYAVELSFDGRRLAHAAFRTAPRDRASAPPRWSFGALSCHQPFDDHGEIAAEADSMLRAVGQAYEEADVRFVLLMGDQSYADRPAHASLFLDEYFARVAPPGRTRLLDCTASEVRALYQRRHRVFWGCHELSRLQSSHCCYPMLDDHEVVDNFGSDPAHEGPAWANVRQGALDAFFDYQGARVHERGPSGERPPFLDWGFRWGPAAVWGMDIRSHRRTVDGVTTVYTDAQLGALQRFLAAHAELPLLVLMTPIPLVHIEGHLVTILGHLLSEGSDLHERWSHPRCRRDRDRFVSILLEHGLAHPLQRIVLLGGDVHAGAAFEIDFSGGVQLVQLTSSAVSNREGWLVRKACESAAHSVKRIELLDGRHGDVGLIRGQAEGRDHNPFGDLNAGIVDVYDHGDRVDVGLRLVSHDGEGNPRIVFETGELGRRRDRSERLTGIDELARPRR
ncbi:alkaline phosphatase D family protein [Paraliomyxa miuraensis]|uniref:alkaline phosphatase D family protein n=1 Tax=Paraliomyxa miuraensis TaxID=376150 RepID=UPI002251D883|nr:alkaline phosphatase D family protein [Paraliomyxa miuraensis]MCX4239238.1 alkaline phosphatase D family protein [Paraliomyxa miuraensis]